jgi:hypothetical protein
MKRITVSVAAFITLASISLISAASNPIEYSDISGHWAREAIIRWSDKEIVTGYGGQFRPDDIVTRGELAAILNRLLKYPIRAENPYSDLTQDMWYYSDMLALSGDDIIPGNPHLARGGDIVTRQDAVYMISKAFGFEHGEANAFTDKAFIADWALPYVNIMVEKGFVSGFPDGTFKPGQPLTRAQVLTILDNMIDLIVDKPSSHSQLPEGAKSVLVNCAGSSFYRIKEIENMYITPGVGEGKVYIRARAAVTNLYIVGTNTNVCIIDNDATATNYRIRVLWDYNDNRFTGGFGVQSDPFRISTEDQFMLLQEFGAADSYYKYFLLTNDIQLTKAEAIIERFHGILDGNGHTVSGINITITDGERGNVGLFGIMRGVVKDLIVDGSISVDTDISIEDDSYVDVGGICGRLDGLIESCTSRVSVAARNARGTTAGGIAGYVGIRGRIKSSSASGTISAQTVFSDNNTQNSMAGGIAGRSLGRVSDSMSSGSVTASGGYNSSAGGIVGTIFSSSDTQIDITYPSYIERSYSTGTVFAKDARKQNDAGGIIGQSQGYASIIRACYSFSEVKTDGDPEYFNASGGIAGAVYEGSQILDCYSAGKVSSTSKRSENSLGGVTGRLRAEMRNCYSICTVTSRTGGVTNTNHVLMGSGLDDGYAVNCADLIDNNMGNLFYTGPFNETITLLSKEEILAQRTYSDRGWDFDDVWTMSESGYPLPMLRGVNDDLQRTQALPAHLRYTR